ncbi:hypothetical protein L2755_11920 [Shewanella abyssi]|uniref:hypothetical protein n=1 Tax=Shewanella abyssi TaxID=311789 RepID=UPI00200F7528|nr:hypothetical protein [Shewanella abyssi]MCL1050331.1 hypothetical protein [Shewanella abyssi]
MQVSKIEELTMNEIEQVNGGVGQAGVIGANLSIIGIGVGIMVAGATAPAWFAVGMIAVSISVTASYLSSN